jgi:hypothetical protein
MTGRSALMDKVIYHTQVNRAFTLSLEDIRHGRYQRLDQLDFPDETVTCLFLEQVSFPLYLLCQFGTDASDTVYRGRLRVECVFPLTQLNTSFWPTIDPQPTALKPLPGSFTAQESKELCTKKIYYALKTHRYLSALQQTSMLCVSWIRCVLQHRLRNMSSYI